MQRRSQKISSTGVEPARSTATPGASSGTASSVVAVTHPTASGKRTREAVAREAPANRRSREALAQGIAGLDAEELHSRLQSNSSAISLLGSLLPTTQHAEMLAVVKDSGVPVSVRALGARFAPLRPTRGDVLLEACGERLLATTFKTQSGSVSATARRATRGMLAERRAPVAAVDCDEGSDGEGDSPSDSDTNSDGDFEPPSTDTGEDSDASRTPPAKRARLSEDTAQGGKRALVTTVDRFAADVTALLLVALGHPSEGLPDEIRSLLHAEPVKAGAKTFLDKVAAPWVRSQKLYRRCVSCSHVLLRFDLSPLCLLSLFYYSFVK